MTPGMIVQRITRDLHEKLLRTIEFTTMRRSNAVLVRICRQWVDIYGLFEGRIRRRDWRR